MLSEGAAAAIAQARLLVAAGELTAASYVLDRQLRSNPGDGAVLIELAQVLVRQGDVGAAERAAQEALSDADSAPWARATLAQIVAMDPDRSDESLDLARDAVRARGDNAGLRIVYATRLGAAGRTEEALAEIGAAFALAPADPFLLAQLHAQAARSLASAPGAMGEARAHAHAAVQLDPTDDDTAHIMRLLDASTDGPGHLPDVASG